MRVFVTSNLKGHYKEFKKLLEDVKFDLDKDKLIVLGNYYSDEKVSGGNNKELMDFLIKLYKENIKRKTNSVHLLLGPNESMYIDALVHKDIEIQKRVLNFKDSLIYDYENDEDLMIKHILFLVNLKSTIGVKTDKGLYYLSYIEKIQTNANAKYIHTIGPNKKENSSMEVNNNVLYIDFMNDRNKKINNYNKTGISLLELNSGELYESTYKYI